MGTGSFSARLAAFLAVTVLVSAMAAVVLWVGEQHRRLQEAVASQAGFVLSETKDSLETQLNLGLALAELSQVEPLLERARVALPGLLSIAILDEEGVVLFSTDAVEVGEADATPEQVASPGIWTLTRGPELLFGLGITTSFDTNAGAVVLRLPVSVINEPIQRYALQLSIGALAVAAPVGLLAWLAGVWIARGPRRSLAGLAQELEALAAPRPEASVADAAAPEAGQAADTLGLPVTAFAQTVRRRAALLAEGEREIARLDELA